MTGDGSVERLGIVGSGAIACGLARAAGASEPAVPVVLWARSDQSASRATQKLDGRGEVTTDLERLSECTVVVEAVAEDAAIKSDLLGRLGGTVPADTILASTTSSLSVAELGAASGRPDRFGALHVFNPVERMKLVELAYPPEASTETRRRLGGLCDALGKTGVEVADEPGFVVNRLLFPYLFDAVRLMESQGLDPKAVDTCMKLGAGHPMGPLALLDFVGLDVAAAIGESIGVEVPERIRALAAEGRLGRKSGAGFYEYEKK
jgi:3-hydroxyacyl-CoA dehydrogenase